jgi:hypothetical protein
MTKQKANKAGARNGAMTLRFQTGRRGRAVPELLRYPQN